MSGGGGSNSDSGGGGGPPGGGDKGMYSSPTASPRDQAMGDGGNKSSSSYNKSYNPGAGGVVEHSPTKSKTTSSRDDNNNSNIVDEVALTGGSIARENYISEQYNQPKPTSNSFDYETEAYKGNVNIDAGYGPGKITSAIYDAKTGKTNIQQTVGIIDTDTYQTANLQAYLDSPDVSDKAKINTLNQLQALSNSNLKGSKLNKVKGTQTTKDFVVENLDIALNNLKNQTKNSKYTSMIDETATTKAKDLSDKPLETVIKSGGIIGTGFSQLSDHYKNNKALQTLGYTGKILREGSSSDRGDTLLTGVQTQSDRDAMNQLAPNAPFITTGTTITKPDSVAAKFFGNTANKFKFSFENEYAAAKARQKTLLGNPSSVGLLAVNQSPFYNFLKDKSLDKGIL